MESPAINSNNRININQNVVQNQPIQIQQQVQPQLRNRPPRTFLQRLRRHFKLSLTIQKISYIEQHKILLLSGKTIASDPEEEKFSDVLRNQLFPSLSIVSLATFIILINTILFIVELSLGFDSHGTILQIKTQTLMLLGMNSSVRVCQGQIYRLIASQYLHVNLLHLLTNNLIILLVIPKYQYTFGPFRVFIIYVLSAISGNMISNLQKSQIIKAGASMSLYGMIGLGVGYIIINWKAFDNIGLIYIFKIIISVILLGLFMILYSDVTQYDYIGYLGAFANGILLSSLSPTIENNKRQIVLRIIFAVIWISAFVMYFIIYFVLKKNTYC